MAGDGERQEPPESKVQPLVKLQDIQKKAAGREGDEKGLGGP